MTTPGLIVVGSGPAGISAAETFRRHDKTLPVTVVTTDPHPPYERPPLSKEYLRGATDEVELHPPQWYAERNVDVIGPAAVANIDTAAHTLTIDGNTTAYRTLILATGADPQPPPVPGGEIARLLRSRADADVIRRETTSAQSAIVIGAGFIGCEAAASLAMRGLSVTIVAPEPLPQAARLGEDAGRRLLALVQSAGVRYRGDVEVTLIEEGGVHLADGDVLRADLVLAATGVKPNSHLAEAAGLHIEQGRILVGPDMATSAADVYAAGDVALAHNTTAGRHLAVEHWQDALDQGSVAGAAAAGVRSQWDGVPGFWSTIGESTVKYHAWGDGYDSHRLVQRDNGFTVWYESDGALVGVLTCEADDDYEQGESLIAAGKPAPV